MNMRAATPAANMVFAIASSSDSAIDLGTTDAVAADKTPRKRGGFIASLPLSVSESVTMSGALTLRNGVLARRAYAIIYYTERGGPGFEPCRIRDITKQWPV